MAIYYGFKDRATFHNLDRRLTGVSTDLTLALSVENRNCMKDQLFRLVTRVSSGGLPLQSILPIGLAAICLKMLLSMASELQTAQPRVDVNGFDVPVDLLWCDPKFILCLILLFIFIGIVIYLCFHTTKAKPLHSPINFQSEELK